MTPEEKEYNKIMQMLFAKKRETELEERECYIKDCKEPAIFSHVVQRNGVLSILEEHNRVTKYQIDVFSGNLEFITRPTKNMMSFRGFCSKHDREIFLPIETKNFDLSIKETRRLFQIRAVLYERRKKEVLTQTLDYMFNLPHLSGFGSPNLGARNAGLKKGMENMDYFLEQVDRPGSFFTRSILMDRIPVCCSTIVPIDSNIEIGNTVGMDYYKLPVNSMVVNIFPHKDCTAILLGFATEYAAEENYQIVDRVEKMNQFEKEKFVTNMLLLQSETWICSPSFYEEKLAQMREKIQFLVFDNSNDSGFKLDSGINLFS